MNWKEFIPVEGKGFTYFSLAALPVLIEGINHCMTWRQWTALPFAIALAGLTATKALNSSPSEKK